MENAPPRILHCITRLGLGGAERSVTTLIGELRAHFQFGLFTMQYAIDDDVGRGMHEELREYGVEIYRGTRLPIKYGGMLTAGAALADAVREFRPDIIHLHTEIPESGYASALAISPEVGRIPLVRTIHNAQYWHHWTRIGKWAQRRMPAADIIAVSADALSTYDHFSNGVGASACSRQIIYNGAKVPDASPRARTAQRPLKLLFAGRFEFQKGADLLPSIVSAVRLEPGTKVELTIAGSGSELPALQKLANQPPEAWKVQLLGPQANLAARLTEFALVLVPSRFEGLSLIAVEALLQRVPVIATSAAGLREAFPPEYPWLASAGDAASFARALEKAMGMTAAWHDTMGDAQQFARERFSLSTMTTQYLKFYRGVLDGGVVNG
jgi:glycosyltransferase involved in cell wall biosynthesis